MEMEKRQEIKFFDTIGFEVQNECDAVKYDIDNNTYFAEFNKLLLQYELAEPNSIKERYFASKLGYSLFYLMKDLKIKGIMA